MTERLRDLAAAALPGALTTLFHVLTASDSWGFFRDELYYVACSQHLGFGYVDHPPLIGLLTWLSRSLFGSSQLGLRLLPAVAGGLAVLLCGLMARELGGGRFAQVLAGTAAALAPAYVSAFGYLSMNAFDVLCWAMLFWILIRLLRTGEPRGWIAFGVVAGIGLENKISVLFLGAGIAAGLVLTRDGRNLRSPWLWAGGAIAAMLFLPHLIWQVHHGWPTLEFMEHATRDKIAPLAPLGFLEAQFWMMSPPAALLGVAGFGFFFFGRDTRAVRLLGWAVLAVLVLMITQRSKPYYLMPAYTALFAAGSVAAGRLAGRSGWGWVRPATLIAVGGCGIALAPLGKPLLPVERHVAYTEWLGFAPGTDERKEVGRLSQFFADRLGWRELAETVGRVHAALPAADRERACVFGQNYGQAGAIDFYRDEYGLPPSLAGHNSYHLWGPGACSGEVMIVIDEEREDLERTFEHVELAATYTCRDCMPYENDKPIWVCRGIGVPLAELWPRVRHFD